jgi:hypothetical protein
MDLVHVVVGVAAGEAEDYAFARGIAGHGVFGGFAEFEVF